MIGVGTYTVVISELDIDESTGEGIMNLDYQELDLTDLMYIYVSRL